VSGLGLVMFAVAIVLMIATGLPVYAVLLAVASAFAALGVALGAFEWQLLLALPSRVVGLLEHDLLQALPLYALIGALLNRLPLAGLMHAAGERLVARSPASAQLSALGVGALLAPMNGSVGASLHMLARRVAPALARRGVAPAEAGATVCVASTLGIVIPPSLVLLLLGDAMMRAHTEAVNVTRAAVRIVNTQDVMRAALLPGLAVLAAALGLAAWRARHRARAVPAPLDRGAAMQAAGAAVVIVVLFGAVATGRLYAVEAAASGGLLLLAWSAFTHRLNPTLLGAVLGDAMTLTGLLMALLVGATSFSLVLRGFGTDALVAGALHTLDAHPLAMLAAVLAGMVACSFVLDAFEMIFLVVPLVMPPLLTVVSDPAWVATLTLLVLQMGFLLPPLGYAVVMSRLASRAPPPMAALARALAPQLAAQALLIAALLLWPGLTHWGANEATGAGAPALSDLEVERLMNAAPRSAPREPGPEASAATGAARP
jgi:TRAP-type mannitol/chloroaromatic compound transport system permease large subunit